MKPRHVIYLSGSCVALYTWNSGRYVPVAGYDLPEGSPDALVGYLGQTPGAVTAIVVDALEEEHHRDVLPRLGRRDRDAMLARKLARTFPRTAYRTAALQGRLPGEPQATGILLSGLSKAEHLRTLQGLLAEARLPVSVVCSPALLCRPLLDKLRPANATSATLVVSRQREGSLRLSFFRGRDLVGTRLMRRSLAAPPGDFARLAKQLEESVRYFDAAFSPGVSNPIDVLLLCEPGVDPARARAGGLGHEGFRFHVPEPADAARRLGLRDSLEAGNADLLFVELLRRYTPAGNFAPPGERRYFHLHRVSVFGKAACLALAAGALVASTLNIVGYLAVTRETSAVRTAAGDIAGQLEASLAGDAGDGADPLEMQRVGTAWQLLRDHEVEPGEILGLVSGAVDANPQVQIDGLDWLPVRPVAEAVAEATDTGSDHADDSDTDTGSVDAPASEQRVRLTIRGRIEPFDGDYPGAFRGVRTFMAALEADPRVVSVKAYKEPLDVDPRSTLTGEMAAGPKADTAAFTINVVLRVSHESA